ncbi:hypothetical protein VTP01DRAFT_7471 [Rhizomucor pusillus]|uniref:uncharacterized protein n=1 Tax=Rhizomucor pusillus TaxID=4840 RepID=UPI0037422550
MLAKGIINVKTLITHKYPLEKAVDAFEHALSGRDGAIKIQIQTKKSNKYTVGSKSKTTAQNVVQQEKICSIECHKVTSPSWLKIVVNKVDNVMSSKDRQGWHR